MRNIKLFKSIFLLGATLISSGCFFHRPAYYPAQVLMKDGVPCFSVTNSREARANSAEISFVSVYSFNEEQMNTVWQRIFPLDEPSLNIFPHECLVYGARTENPPELQKGVRYRVNMNGYIGGSNRMYYANFCLYKTPEGRTEIHRAEWDDKMHKRDWGMCKIENE